MLLLCVSSTTVPSNANCMSVMLLAPLACAETCTGEFTKLPSPGEEIVMAIVSAALELAASTFDPPPMQPANSSSSKIAAKQNSFFNDLERKEERTPLHANQSRFIALTSAAIHPWCLAAYRDWPVVGDSISAAT